MTLSVYLSGPGLFFVALTFIWRGQSIIMIQCVAYIHDPHTTLTIDLKFKFRGFLTWHHGFFLSLGIVIHLSQY